MARKKGKEMDGVPYLSPKNTAGVALRASEWKLHESKGDEKWIKCEVRLAEWTHPNMYGVSSSEFRPQGNDMTSTKWIVCITRPLERKGGKLRPSRAYKATIELWIGDEIALGTSVVSLFAGQAHSWAEAVDDVSRFADFGRALRSIGNAIYGDPSQWERFRPFTVVWPWDDVREPNAIYSEFKLAGPWSFQETDDGAVALCHNPQRDQRGRAVDNTESRRITTMVGGNAFIVPALTSNGSLEWRCYHRSYMNHYDIIDPDSWRARIIAGAGETFE